jgi:hypothetical protein
MASSRLDGHGLGFFAANAITIESLAELPPFSLEGDLLTTQPVDAVDSSLMSRAGVNRNLGR